MPGPRSASDGPKREPYSNKGDRAGSGDNLGFRSIDDFEQGEILGRGSFCRVVHCTDCISGRACALKLAPKGEPAVDAACAMEAHCLRRLARSPLIVNLLWDMDDGIQWVAVLELCDGGELWSHIKHCGCLMEGESSWYGSQMVEALAAVHAVGIVHRDVRCENFLICRSDHSVKMIDFGTARDTNQPGICPVPPASGESEHYVGKPHFMAPEVTSGEMNDRRSDLWSLGCALYQLVIGAPPFRSPSPTLVQARAQEADLWFPQHGINSREKDLITSLVRREPDQRMGARHTRKVLLHPLLQDPPLEFPADTLLARGLRRVACAIDQEAAAAETTHWTTEQPGCGSASTTDGSNVASAGDFEPLSPRAGETGATIAAGSAKASGGGGRSLADETSPKSAGQAMQVGAATALLLKELPAALGIDAHTAHEKVTGMQPRILSRFSPSSSPRGFTGGTADAVKAGSGDAVTPASGRASPRSPRSDRDLAQNSPGSPRQGGVPDTLVDEPVASFEAAGGGDSTLCVVPEAEAIAGGEAADCREDAAVASSHRIVPMLATVAVAAVAGGQGPSRVAGGGPRHSPSERALLEVVHVAAAEAAEAGAPHELGKRLSQICLEAAKGGSRAVPVALLLPSFACEHVARFAEMAQQRLSQVLPRPCSVSECDSDKASSVPTVAAEGQRPDDEALQPDSGGGRSLQEAAGDVDEEGLTDGLLFASAELNLSRALADESPMVPPKESIAVSLRRPGMTPMGGRPWGGTMAIDTGPSPVFLPCAEAEPHPPPEPESPATTIDTQANVAVEIRDEQGDAVKAKEDQSDLSLTRKPPGRRRCCARRLRG